MGEAVPELPALDDVDPDAVGEEVAPDYDDEEDDL